MTKLGKTLVFLNLALSLMAAGWAQGVYASRIDWSTNKGNKDGVAEGELVRRVARIQELSGNAGVLGPAGLSWNDGRALIAALDNRRVSNRLWYESELAFDRSGATRADPARVVKLDKGQPVLAKPGVDDRPLMVQGRDQFGQPLQSLKAYNLAEEALQQQIEATNKNLTKTLEEDAELTNKIAGDPNGTKGLQQRILEERTKFAEAKNEQGYVRGLLVTAVVDSDLVFKRQRSLEARVKELGKVGVAGK
jgi:hypothetical protein